MSKDGVSKGKSSVAKPSRRSMARFWSVMGLYEMEKRGAFLSEILYDYKHERLNAPLYLDDGQKPLEFHPADEAYFMKIVGACVRGQKRIDGALSKILETKSWPLARLDAVLRALLRVSAAEFMLETKVPARVVINESVELAKSFFSEGSEVKLVNAVLDRLAHGERPEEFDEQDPYHQSDHDLTLRNELYCVNEASKEVEGGTHKD